MAGQIGRQHAEAVMGERPRELHPDRMIEAGTVQENDRRQRRIEIAAAGGDEGSFPSTISCMAQARCEARSACAKSSMMSPAASSPTETRTSSSPTPAAASAAASIC